MEGMVWYTRAWLRRGLRQFIRDERGLETIEIVLIAALVIIGTIVLWRSIGEGLVKKLTGLCDEIADNCP